MLSQPCISCLPFYTCGLSLNRYTRHPATHTAILPAPHTPGGHCPRVTEPSISCLQLNGDRTKDLAPTRWLCLASGLMKVQQHLQGGPGKQVSHCRALTTSPCLWGRRGVRHLRLQPLSTKMMVETLGGFAFSQEHWHVARRGYSTRSSTERVPCY